MNEVNRRNTETIEQALRDIYAKIYALDERVTRQNAAIMSLIERMTLLETATQLQKMKLTGLGATVKE